MNPAHGLRSLVRQWVVPVESPPKSRPQFVIPAKAGIQRGGAGCGNDARTLTNQPQCSRHRAIAIIPDLGSE